MKALTIYPVWAWAIMAGHKRVENRTWTTKHRGRLAIHASANSAAARKSDTIARKVLGEMGIEVPEEVTTGALLGTVELVDVIEPDDKRLATDPLSSGPLCWLLKNVQPLKKPVPCRGRQQLWNADDRLLGRQPAKTLMLFPLISPKR